MRTTTALQKRGELYDDTASDDNNTMEEEHN